MITFYPRDIELWRSCPEFDLTQRGNILLAVKTKRDYKVFQKRSELIEFLKEFAQIKIDGGGIPLEITGPHDHSEFGPLTYNVQHWILLGWLTQTFTNE
jgi:hypothetical protein